MIDRSNHFAVELAEITRRFVQIVCKLRSISGRGLKCTVTKKNEGEFRVLFDVCNFDIRLQIVSDAILPNPGMGSMRRCQRKRLKRIKNHL